MGVGCYRSEALGVASCVIWSGGQVVKGRQRRDKARAGTNWLRIYWWQDAAHKYYKRHKTLSYSALKFF